MVTLKALVPAPLAAVRQRSSAACLVAVGLRLVLAVAVVDVLAGVTAALRWEPSTAADAVPDGEVCTDPPCLPRSWPGLRDLPVVVAPLGYLLAVLLGASALLLSLAVGGWRHRPRALLPVLGPLAVLVAMEVVPHVANPCLFASVSGNDLPSGCSRTVHGVDVHDRLHALHHAVVGGVPAALGYAALLRRRRPELFARAGQPSAPPSRANAQPRRRPGAEPAGVAPTDPGLGHRADHDRAQGAPRRRVVPVAAAASALGGAAWVVKAAAILATGDQPPLVYETAPLLLAVGLLGVHAMLVPASTITRCGGWAAVVAVLLGLASLTTSVTSTTSDGGFSPLTLATSVCTVAGLVLLGLASRRQTALAWPVRVLPLLLGVLTVPLLAVGGALAVLDERLLEVPLLVLGLGWIVLGHGLWTSATGRHREAAARVAT